MTTYSKAVAAATAKPDTRIFFPVFNSNLYNSLMFSSLHGKIVKMGHVDKYYALNAMASADNGDDD